MPADCPFHFQPAMNRGDDNRSECNIPLELWAAILAYLPVKSVVRFRSVSRSWKSMIENPNFCSVHLKCSRNPYLISCEANGREQRQWVLRNSETFQKDLDVEFSARGFNCESWSIFNGVDGLILLLEIEIDSESQPHENILLWNPSIKKTVYLPRPPDIPLKIYKPHLCILFDALSDEYKVVVIRQSTGIPLVDVFSLKTHSWRRVGDRNSLWLFLPGGCACIDGFAHWIGTESGKTDRGVISFDVSSNMFSYIPLPTKYVADGLERQRLLILSGSVLGLLKEYTVFNRITIWAMERSSSAFDDQCPRSQCWTKRYQINVALEGFPTFYLTVQKRDILLQESVVLVRGSKSWILCDLETGESKLLQANDWCYAPDYIHPYVESLLLLGS